MHRSKSRGPQPISHKIDYGEYRPPMQAGQGHIRQVVVEDPKTTYWKQRALLAEGAQAQRASGYQNVQGERDVVSSEEQEPPQQGGPQGGEQGYETQQGQYDDQGRSRSRSSVSTFPGEGLSAEAKAFRQQEQIQQIPSYEVERQPSPQFPEGLPQGVPPPVGSDEYREEYNRMLHLGLTTTQIEEEFRRRLRDWDRLNMSFGQNLPS
ncbi:MAG: hypothetical protein GY820_22280, partial [Gammaproteobacteria bacterium]|nr:hypothetical protein [Gammaproteobacteria bacterium]